MFSSYTFSPVQTDFLSIRMMLVSAPIPPTLPMHHIKNVLTKRMLKKWPDLMRKRSCRIARNLDDQGTWLPIRPAVTYVLRFLGLQLPNTLLNRLMVCVYHAAKQKNLVKHGGDWKYSS